MASRISRNVVVAVAALACAASTTACGILNGLFWDAEVTDDELCAALADVNAKEQQCRGGGGEGEGAVGEGEGAVGEGEGEGGQLETNCVDTVSCLREKRSQCASQWQAFLTCALDDNSKRDCADVTADNGFCDTALQAYIDCSGIDVNNCNNGGGQCNFNGICDGGEDVSSCSDCNQQGKCNGNGICEPPPGGNEDEGCNECCNHDSQCQPNEGAHPELCPSDCSGSGCNTNGVCDNTETQGTCGDCGPCSNNGTCEPFESHVECPDCTGGGGQCNTNGICDNVQERDSGCADCNGVTCSFDAICQRGESFFCGECFRPCTSPAQCGGGDQKCDSFNAIACGANPPDVNCRSDVPTQAGCWLRCSSSSDCDEDFTCVATLGAADGFGACEPAGCNAVGSTCDPTHRCVDAFAMRIEAAGLGGGLCLQNDCDPVACAETPASCACLNAGAPRCASAKTAGGNFDDFVCVPPGPLGLDQPCTDERNCGQGTTCFNNVCRLFCNNIGAPCVNAAGTCTALPGQTTVGACN